MQEFLLWSAKVIESYDAVPQLFQNEVSDDFFQKTWENSIPENRTDHTAKGAIIFWVSRQSVSSHSIARR